MAYMSENEETVIPVKQLDNLHRKHWFLRDIELQRVTRSGNPMFLLLLSARANLDDHKDFSVLCLAIHS